MKNIFGYLWKAKFQVLMIVALLVLQAYCDLALPTYTAQIVDVGITKKGIEELAPRYIRDSELDKLMNFVPEDKQENVKKAYEQTGKKSADGSEILECKEKSMEEMEELLGKPVMLFSMMSSMEESDKQNYSGAGIDTEKLQALQAKMYGESATNSSRVEALDEVYDMFGSVKEMMLENMNGAYLAKEYEICDVNMKTYQKNYLWIAGAKMMGVSFAGMIVAIFVGLIASRVGASTARELRNQIFRKVASFSNVEMDQFSTASLITRSTNDIQQVQQVIVLLLKVVLFAPILAIGGIIKVLQTNASMGWIIALAVAVILAIIGVLLVVAMPKFKSMQLLIDKLNLVAREILTGLPVIRAFGREEHERERFDVANKELMKTQLFVNRVMALLMPLMTLVLYGVNLGILWFGAKGIDSGNMQVGEMTAFITYSMQIVMSFMLLSMISIVLPRSAVSATRVDEIINTEIQIKDKEQVVSIPANVPKTVTFEHVSFAYPNAESEALVDIDFTAKPGETTAIIGSTGSGKSTVVNLIPRLYDVTEGRILVGGVDVRDMSQKELRSHIGFVPQKANLFSGTIASNLQFGKEDASEAEMERAAVIAQAKDVIDGKEKGYDSEISQGGTNVSGGQKQRLSIARALVKNADIYIFDDSFSALDLQTDRRLRQALKEEITDATLIIVAQRISTIMNAEQIIVLDEGQIVGKGTHAELLASCEVYKQIAQSQLSAEEIEQSLQAKAGKEARHE